MVPKVVVTMADNTHSFYLEGIISVSAALSSGRRTINNVFVDKAKYEKRDRKITHLISTLKKESIPFTLCQREKINEFAEKCKEKIESGESLASEIPGNRPYVDYKQLPFVVSSDETLCSFCYDCVSICPEKAIPDDDPIDTDLDLCSRCAACISICPEDARSFTGEAFEKKKPIFEKVNSERKEPEFFL